ncbi:Ist1p [Sporobolomyces salmoneus]|uniref:Ist1p n=1 Tax=Sporobolomyces salmoneus TaxID=183962 RepID=UPI00316D7328
MPPPTAWTPSRARIQLKLSIQRTRILATKKSQLAKSTRREIANLLDKGKIESARIKVEGIMQEDLMCELLELLELFCEVLLARFGLLENTKEIDPGVTEAVASIIHAAPRTELKELHVLREMLMSKAGRDYSIAAIDNIDGIVPGRITSKLTVQTPPTELVDLYLYEIAKAYSVDWRPQGFPDPDNPTPATTSEPPTTPSRSKPPPHIAPFDSDSLSTAPQPPQVDPEKAKETVIVRTSLPSPALSGPPPASSLDAATETGGKKKESDEDAFEALTKRFAELKKR